MTVPSGDITVLDGALGVVPQGNGDVAAVIAPATGGPLNLPAAFSQGSDVKTNFKAGELVEWAHYLLKAPGRPAVVVRSEATTAGGYGTVDNTGMTGSADASAHAATVPVDEYDAKVLFVAGGTVGVSGITYKTSLDGGRTYGQLRELGTATTITFEDGNVAFDLTTSTVVAGDYFTCATTAPAMTSSDLAAALTALQATGLWWDFLVVGGVVDAAMIIQLDAWAASLWALGKHKKIMCSVRRPTAGETEAQYYAACQAIRAAAGSSQYVAVCAGDSLTQSGVSNRQYMRPAHWACAARACSSLVDDSARISLAQVAADGHGGRLPADVKIQDANKNPIAHDEWANPGLDDLGFMVLRTFPGRDGTFINLPRTFAAVGSDWRVWHYISLRNKAADAIKPYLEEQLEKPIRADSKTGFIYEADAKAIEEGAKDILKAAIGNAVSPNGISFTIVRGDNILSTQRLRTKLRMVPLVYFDKADCELGLINPARVVAA